MLQGMCHPHFLPGRRQRQVAAPGEPLGAVVEAPLQPAGALVELADHDEEFTGGGSDPRTQGEDVPVEFLDRGQVCRHGGSSGNKRDRTVILYSNDLKNSLKQVVR